MSDAESGLDAHVGQFRDVRRQLEDAVHPVGDLGRRAPLLLPGSLAGSRAPARRVCGDRGQRSTTRLGQVLDVEVAHMDGPEVGREIGEAADAFDLRSRTVLRLARGSGVVLDGQSGPFHDASVHAAPPDAVSAWMEGVSPAARP